MQYYDINNSFVIIRSKPYLKSTLKKLLVESILVCARAHCINGEVRYPWAFLLRTWATITWFTYGLSRSRSDRWNWLEAPPPPLRRSPQHMNQQGPLYFDQTKKTATVTKWAGQTKKNWGGREGVHTFHSSRNKFCFRCCYLSGLWFSGYVVGTREGSYGCRRRGVAGRI